MGGYRSGGKYIVSNIIEITFIQRTSVVKIGSDEVTKVKGVLASAGINQFTTFSSKIGVLLNTSSRANIINVKKAII